MSDPFIGEIRMFAGSFVPEGWLTCDGSVQPMQQFEALGAIVGATFGGDGRTTFGLPDLRANAVIGVGQGVGLTIRSWGKQYGEPTVTLDLAQSPPHTHQLQRQGKVYADKTVAPSHTSDLGTLNFGTSEVVNMVTANGTPNTTLNSATVATAGESSPHPNEQPYLPLIACIAWNGVFPIRG